MSVMDMLKGWLGNSFNGHAQVPRSASLGNNPQLGRNNAQGGEFILTSGSDLNKTAYGGIGLQGNRAVAMPDPSKYPPKRKGGDAAGINTFDYAADGEPWPTLLDGGVKLFTAFRPNVLRNVEHHNRPASYAWHTSTANFGFRGKWMDSARALATDIAGYPGPVPAANQPEYNVLTPIVWRLRVLDPKQQAQATDLIQTPVVQVASSSFTPGGAASLRETLL